MFIFDKHLISNMWPFRLKKSLYETGIFNGLIDWHSHILPGVDDGIKTLDEAIRVLQSYEDLGVKKIWLTPHIMEDYPNSTEELRLKYQELKSLWKGNLEIKLAAENMLDNLFENRLDNNDLLPIGDDGNHLLIETSYYTPPFGMDEMLEKIKHKGYFPILAHPERYRYMDKKDYIKLKEDGLLFQLNFLSLVGGYGETARDKAEWLLKEDMIDLIGSDVHKLESVMSQIKIALKRKEVEKLLIDLASRPKIV